MTIGKTTTYVNFEQKLTVGIAIVQFKKMYTKTISMWLVLDAYVQSAPKALM
jgi:hypothetical protein